MEDDRAQVYPVARFLALERSTDAIAVLSRFWSSEILSKFAVFDELNSLTLFSEHGDHDRALTRLFERATLNWFFQNKVTVSGKIISCAAATLRCTQACASESRKVIEAPQCPRHPSASVSLALATRDSASPEVSAHLCAHRCNSAQIRADDAQD